MRRIAFVCAAVVGFAALFGSVSSIYAQIAPPNAVNFQARLATSDGNPVPDGTYAVRVRIYDGAAGNTVLHEQTFASLAVKNGIIAVLMAGFTADKFNGNAFLGIKLNADIELAPRIQIVSVPYALKSTLALTVPNGSITNAKLAGGITADKLFGGTLNDTAWLLGGNVASTVRFLGTLTHAPVSFVTNGFERMRIDEDGKVGIGTGTPGDSLTVAGRGTAITAIDANVRTRLFSSFATGTGYVGTASVHSFAVRTSDADRLIVTSSGIVGVGNNGFGNVRLGASANGLEYAFGTFDRMVAAGYNVASDARLKEHIETVPDALSTLLGLRGVSYDWEPNSFVGKRGGKGRQYGFLAQEVEQILPALVQPGLNGYKAVNYMGIIPVTVEAIKTLHARSVAQQSHIEMLRKENEGTRSENAVLRSLLDTILKRLN